MYDLKSLKKFAVSFAVILLISQSVWAATWYVDTTADNDPFTCVSGDMIEDGNCTFRDALNQAGNGDSIEFLNMYTINNTGGTYNVTEDSIMINTGSSDITFDGAGAPVDGFDISGNNVSVNNITVTNGFNNGVVVSGDSVSLDHLEVTSNTGSGIVIGGNSDVVRNSVINRNTGSGISVNGASNFDLDGNHIGTDEFDSTPLGNGSNGITLTTGAVSGSNVIRNNIITSNTGDGINLYNGTMSGTLEIQGNTIGKPDALSALTGNDKGINVRTNSVNTMDIIIGSDGDGVDTWSERNVISGNNDDGINVKSGNSLTVMNNVIGLDNSSGTTANSNNGEGIDAGIGSIVIGTNNDGVDDSNEGNVISSNLGSGVAIYGNDTSNVSILGNIIGGDSTGIASGLGNTGSAINIGEDSIDNVQIGEAGVSNYEDGSNTIIENGSGIYVSRVNTDATIDIENNYIGVEKPNYSSPAVVGNNLGVGLDEGIKIDLNSGTADVDISRNDIAGHDGNGIEINNGVKNLTIDYNRIGVVFDDYSYGYDRAGGNDGAGIYVNSTDANLASVIIGGSGANRIADNGANGVHIADAGTASPTIDIIDNDFGIAEDNVIDLGNTGDAILIEDGGNITISENTVVNSSSVGVHVTGGETLNMLENTIGNVDHWSLLSAGNSSYGIHINAPTLTSFILGSATFGLGNVISSSGSDGVFVETLASDTSTVNVFGNIIGLCARPSSNMMDSSNLAVCKNGGDGLKIDYGSVTIGGDNGFGVDTMGNIDAANVISNNDENGIFIGDNVTSASILGNIIGMLRAVSEFDISAGNGVGTMGGDGININSSSLANLTIGGVGSVTASSLSNWIVDNGNGGFGNGISINNLANSAVTSIVNNLIGVSWNGNSATFNNDHGLYADFADVHSDIRIGGSAVDEGNIIASNLTAINLENGDISILGNNLGVAADGVTLLFGASGQTVNIVTTKVSSLIFGSASAPNIVNNTDADGLLTKLVTSDNEQAGTLSTDNTWSDIPGTNHYYWARMMTNANPPPALFLANYAPNGPAACADNLDNDSDGLMDLADPGCTDASDDDETDPVVVAACADGVDNDSDGLIDLADPGCTDASDDDETDPASGGGSSGSGGGGSIVAISSYGDSGSGDDGAGDDGSGDDGSGDDGSGDDGSGDDGSGDDGSGDDGSGDDGSGDDGSGDDGSDYEEYIEYVDDVQDVIDASEDLFDDVVAPYVPQYVPSNTGSTDTYDHIYDDYQELVSDDEVDEDLESFLGTLGSDDEEVLGNVEESVRDLVAFRPTSLGSSVRSLGSGSSYLPVDRYTDFVFEDDYARAVTLQDEANASGENRVVFTSFSDLDRNGISDVLELRIERDLDAEAGNGSFSEDIFFGRTNLFGSSVRPDSYNNGLRITSLPLEEAIVGQEAMIWIAGEHINEFFELLVIPEDELDAYLNRHDEDSEYDDSERIVADGYLDDAMRAAVDIEFEEEIQYYIIVRNENERGSMIEVRVDFELNDEVTELEINEDNLVTGYVEPGTLVFVTWHSVVMNSVVLADAGEGYFEIEAPLDLDDGDHTVTVYNYKPANKSFGGLMSRLFKK